MITQQIIQDKLKNLTEEQLNQVYDVIESLNQSESHSEKPSFMSKLQDISIDAPSDFSVQVAVSLGRDISEK